MRYVFFLLILFSCGENFTIDNNTSETVDSIISFRKNNNSYKKILFPSKKKDSFDYVKTFRNDSLISLGYESENKKLRRFWYKEFYEDYQTIGQYFIFDNEEYLNQVFFVEGNDTLSIGNSYEINYFGKRTVNKKFQFQVFLNRPYLTLGESRVKLLVPKSNYTDLKKDFTNWKELKYDTIPNYSDYYKSVSWDSLDTDKANKYAVALNLAYKSAGKKPFRGVLIEEQDSLGSRIERYLFVDEYIEIK